MTVIQPNKNRNITRLIILLSVVVAIAVSFNVALYATAVSLRHDIQSFEGELEKMQVRNAESKSALYDLVATERLEKFAQEQGLVKDKNPQWAFVSHF